LLYDAITTGHVLRDLPVEVQESPPKSASKASSEAEVKQQVEPEPIVDTSQHGLSMDTNALAPMDFSLPGDLWGDSIWGMFDPIAPVHYPAYTGPDVNVLPGDQYAWQ
jgi:hypothetical protein